MELPQNIAFAVGAWCIAASVAFCASVITGSSKSLPVLLATAWLAGGISFSVVGYLCRDATGILGHEWYYLSIAVAVGLFARQAFEWANKRLTKVLNLVAVVFLKRFGIDEDDHDDGRQDREPESSDPGRDD
jgi:hypothetical protein